MQNVQKEKRPKENLTMLKKSLFEKMQKKLTIELNNSSTLCSPRKNIKTFNHLEKDFPALYKLTFIDFSSIDLDQTSEKKKTRKDNFGRKIKKGGKQKIVFADELDFVKPMKLDGKKINEEKNDKKYKRRITNIESKEEKNKKKEKNELFKKFKRSNSFDISTKNCYGINNFYFFKRKPSKFNNLDIIDIESTKKENKLNTYFFRKNLALGDEDNVSCSCYCNIF